MADLNSVWQRRRGWVSFLASAWIIGLVLVRPVFAQSSSAQDLINKVNALRASLGLAPYTVDAGLMAYAQEHAEYLAATQRGTHIHKDGSIPWDIGVSENVASGSIGYISPDVAVYTIWADVVHMKTMTGFPTGAIGAGVASDGKMLYYSIDVRPSGVNIPVQKTKTTALAPLSSPSPMPRFVPLITMTPRADGSILHIVGYGQTLTGIAKIYGVKIEEIQRLNGYAAENSTIYENQKLLVRAPGVLPAAPINTLAPGLPPADTRPPPSQTPPSVTPTSDQQVFPSLSPTAFTTQTPPPPIGNTPSLSTIVAGVIGLIGGGLFTLFLGSLLDLRKSSKM